MDGLSTAQETALARLPVLGTAPGRRAELAVVAQELHEQGVPWQDIAAAAGIPTTTLVSRLAKTTNGGARVRGNVRCPAGTWRQPTAAEVQRMRALWEAVPAGRRALSGKII